MSANYMYAVNLVSISY